MMDKIEEARLRAKAWYHANKERAKARIRAWQIANPDKRKAHVKTNNRNRADAKKAWKEAHPESDARYYAANKQRVAENVRAWGRSNPAKVKAYRVARKRKIKVEQRCSCCTPNDFAKLFQLGTWCGAHVDHIVPLQLGGMHCCKNLQLMAVEDHKQKTKDDLRAIAAQRRMIRANARRLDVKIGA